MNKGTPTIEFYNRLDEAFNFYNENLFENKLDPVFFTVRSGETKDKTTRILGYYWKKVFAHKDNPISEIALNINAFSDRSLLDILSTLVHEMTHQWRDEVSTEPPSKHEIDGGHDDIWANKMMQIGLIPSNTGIPGGKKTGKKMTHYIDENGKFSQVSKNLIKSGFYFNIFDSYGSQINKSNSFVKISPINTLIEQKWLEDEDEETKETLKKALNIMASDPNVVQVDITDLTIPVKIKKPREKKFKFICPSCKTAISGPESFSAICLNCDEVYELKK